MQETDLGDGVAPHFAHHNFVRPHGSLRIASAMVAGVSDMLPTLETWVEQTVR
jgi:hypothetical protein